MFQEPRDFRDESAALDRLLESLAEEDFGRPTLFKDWTIDDVVRHLHVWNRAANESAFDPEAFVARKAELVQKTLEGIPLGHVEAQWHDGKRGLELLAAWRETYLEMAERWAAEDPERRVEWVGPDMTLQSSITARLMETWAHAQAVYDLLGVERADTDRIQGIAFLGVRTFRWTFQNRGLEAPSEKPHVRLTAPSGAEWTWNEPSETNLVEGSATEFCQVVAQTRNVTDTSLRVIGEPATRWMEIAQCFAGPPETPPVPGARHRAA